MLLTKKKRNKYREIRFKQSEKHKWSFLNFFFLRFFFFFFGGKDGDIYILRIRWRYTCVSNSEIQFMGWKRNRWLVFFF